MISGVAMITNRWSPRKITLPNSQRKLRGVVRNVWMTLFGPEFSGWGMASSMKPLKRGAAGSARAAAGVAAPAVPAQDTTDRARHERGRGAEPSGEPSWPGQRLDGRTP